MSATWGLSSLENHTFTIVSLKLLGIKIIFSEIKIQGWFLQMVIYFSH